MLLSWTCALALSMLAADPIAPQMATGEMFAPASPAYGSLPSEQSIPPEPLDTWNGSAGASTTPVAYTAANEAAAAPADGPKYFTLGELKAQMKSLAWTKGDFTIIPYGILWANWVEESGRTTPGNYPLYVSRPQPGANTDTYVDVRSTRLGMEVVGPRVPALDCAVSGGKVEIDFQRQIDVENKPSLLLRHAYVEVKNEDFRLLAGQTWDIVSPLNPGVLFYSVGWDGGNIGYRRTQFRAERYMAMSDCVFLTAQGSINTDAVADTSFTGGTALADSWPMLEGRLALMLGERGPGCLPWEFGVSSHVGDLTYYASAGTANPLTLDITGDHRRTWSLNTDVRMPITSRFGVQGELFIGENLGSLLGGIGQSVDVVGFTGVRPSGSEIGSRGGWIDIWYDWTPRLHSHTGYSIDDPYDQDVTSGRIYNAFYFANISYDLTAKFMVGFEYSFWRTIWAGPAVDATSNNFNFVVKYGF